MRFPAQSMRFNYLRLFLYTRAPTATPAAISATMLGSGIATTASTEKATPGSIKKSAVISFCDFIDYSLMYYLSAATDLVITGQDLHQLLRGTYESYG